MCRCLCMNLTCVVLSAMSICQSFNVNEACFFSHYISISCSLSQYKMVLLHRDWEYLACQQTDRFIALYWGPVILGCLIRNSTEFSYLEEEERRPWGKLRLWQGFITAIISIYIGFVAACMHYLTNKTPAHHFTFAYVWVSPSGCINTLSGKKIPPNRDPGLPGDHLLYLHRKLFLFICTIILL